MKRVLVKTPFWEEEARRYSDNADYWRERCEEAERKAADYKERYDFQWEMRSLGVSRDVPR